MSAEFRLPDVGEGIHEAEIIRWLVHEGQRVTEFESIVEIQTDKAVVELPAPKSGYICEIVTPPGTVAHVGDILVRISETRDGWRGASAPSTADTAAQVQAVESRPEIVPQNVGLRPLATPGIRHFARQMNVDLGTVSGTGANGRILKSDILEAARTKESEIQMPSTEPHGRTTSSEAASMWEAVQRLSDQGDEKRTHLQAGVRNQNNLSPTKIPFRGLRRATAEHVKRSAFTVPHVTAFDDCDATALVTLRSQWNAELAERGKRLSYLPFLMKATVSALRAFPYFNARLDEEAAEIELIPDYHIGIAVDTPDGLLVPVVRNADTLSIQETSDEIQRLTHGARARTLATQELRGSTFTITNMGPIGGLFATPIINYPEVGILAVHKIARKPVVVGDEIVIRDVLTLSVSFDHRVIDGATSVRFMNHIKRLVEHPELLMLELK